MNCSRMVIGLTIMAALAGVGPALAQSSDQGMRSSSPGGANRGVRTGSGPLSTPVAPAPNLLYPQASGSGTRLVPGPSRTHPPKDPFGTNPSR